MLKDFTESEFAALRSVKLAIESTGAKFSKSVELKRGWMTVTEIREFSDQNEYNNIRPSLKYLAENGYLNQKITASIRHFRITKKGENLLQNEKSFSTEIDTINSTLWTGIIEPIQIQRVLIILSDMEDVCETIRNNRDRAQIFGLIRALEIILSIPDPPRQGIVSLLRDPAFANIVNVGTFLAALIAAVKP